MEPPTKSVLAPPRHPNPLKNVYKAKQIKVPVTSVAEPLFGPIFSGTWAPAATIFKASFLVAASALYEL